MATRFLTRGTPPHMVGRLTLDTPIESEAMKAANDFEAEGFSDIEVFVVDAAGAREREWKRMDVTGAVLALTRMEIV